MDYTHKSITKPKEELIHVDINKEVDISKQRDDLSNLGNIPENIFDDQSFVTIPLEEIETASISLVGEENVTRIENQKQPVLNTKYVKSSFYRETYDPGENLEALRDNFGLNEYKRYNIFGKEKSDSKEMRNIIDSLDDLLTYLPKYAITRNMERGDFENVLNWFETKYKTILENCSTYLYDSGKNKTNRRYALVKRMHASASRDLSLFRSMAENTYDAIIRGEENEAIRWADVLRDCRSVHYVNGQNGVKISQTGAASSNIIVIETEDQKLFFKEDEHLKNHSIEDVREKIRESIKSPGNGLNDEEKSKAEYFEHRIFRAFDAVGATWEQQKKFLSKLYEAYNGQINSLDRNDIEKTINKFFKDTFYISSGYKDLKNELINMLLIPDNYKIPISNLNKDELNALADKNKKIFKAAFTEVGRNLFEARYMKTMANIPEGALITTNNVVASRMADLLNVDFIANSKSAIITVNGVTKKGIVMEEAKGQSLSKIPDLRQNVDTLLKYEKQAADYCLKAEKYYENKLDAGIATLVSNGVFREGNANLLSFKRKQELIAQNRNHLSEEMLNDINNAMQIFTGWKDQLDAYTDPQKFGKFDIVKKTKILMGLAEDAKINIANILQLREIINNDTEHYQPKYMPQVKRDLLSLSIMDFILGQTDRHLGNFHVETEDAYDKQYHTFYINNIHAIDNDGCCGLYTGKELDAVKHLGIRTSKLKTGKRINIPALDLDFAERIRDLDPADLAMNFADLLSREQLKAMIDRLDYVKSIIRGELKKVKSENNTIKFIKNIDEWDAFGQEEADKASLIKYNPLFFREIILKDKI